MSHNYASARWYFCIFLLKITDGQTDGRQRKCNKKTSPKAPFTIGQRSLYTTLWLNFFGFVLAILHVYIARNLAFVPCVFWSHQNCLLKTVDINCRNALTLQNGRFESCEFQTSTILYAIIWQQFTNHIQFFSRTNIFSLVCAPIVKGALAFNPGELKITHCTSHDDARLRFP